MSDPFPSAAPPIVEVQRLTRQFDSKIALNDLWATIVLFPPFAEAGGCIVSNSSNS